MHLHPIFSICVFPVLCFISLLILPYWNNSTLPEGVWFGGDRGRKLAIIILIISAIITATTVLLDDLAANMIGSPATGIFTRGILPLVSILVLYCLGYYTLTTKFRYTRGETVMAGFIFMVTAMICLTIIGIWFRGPGMQLVLPFQ